MNSTFPPSFPPLSPPISQHFNRVLNIYTLYNLFLFPDNKNIVHLCVMIIKQYRTNIVPQMRRSASAVNSRGSLRFAPLCTQTEHSLLAVFTLLTGAVRARTGQFAGFAPLRSALHSYRTFTTRGRYFIDRCGACPHWAIRGGRSTSFRSALIPNIHYSRSLLY